MKDPYASIAWCYDTLASIAFAGRIRKSQLYLLNHVGTKANVLIFGGGTGWIAHELLKQKPDATITYLDASPAMIKRAKARLESESIQWVTGDETQIPTGYYDVVLLPFILDSFPDEKLMKFLLSLKLHLHQNSIVLITDFTNQTLWHRWYLKFLYWFFKITTNIQTQSLPLWEKLLNESGFVLRERQPFFNNFIIATFYTLR